MAPVARFVGTPGAAGPDGGYWTTWYPTAEALVRMVEVAGFGDAEFRDDETADKPDTPLATTPKGELPHDKDSGRGKAPP